jgi:RHS repeat-associated protein
VNYGYDDLYRLTSETVASDPGGRNGQVTYSYDSVGNRTQLSSTLAAVPPTGLLNYDANDRTATDSHDANGNLTFNGQQNVYDFENRLVQRGGVKIVYDGDGNRVQETVAGVVTRYLTGEVNPTGYVQVLAELSSTNQMLRGYEWGLQLAAVRDFTVNPGGIFHYYGLDGHGSVRFLTDSSGAVTDTYDYDAFGNLISQTGTTPNNYLFAGEQFDPALGIYYNRARYYDQRQGRFWTMDSLEENEQDPLTLHKYLYANANPTNDIDPSGLETGISNGNIGAQVQAAVGAYFRAETGGCVDQQIPNILAGTCNEAITPGVSAPEGLRPDLANPNPGMYSTGAVYEIKPTLSAVLGGIQLGGYIRALKKLDPAHRNWHRGTADEFLTQPHILPLSGTSFALVSPPVKGVIIYYVVDLKDGLGVLATAAVLSAGSSAYKATAIINAARTAGNVVSISGVAAQAEAAEIETEVGNTAVLNTLAPTG